jgi:hypothetical protein
MYIQVVFMTKHLSYYSVIAVALTLLVIVLLNPMATPASANPDTLSVERDAVWDTHVDEANPTTVFSSNAYLQVGVSSVEFPGDCFAIVEFYPVNWEWVPPGSTITSAKMAMYLDHGSGHTGGVTLHASAVTADWANPGCCHNWNNRPSWGAAFDSTVVGTTAGWYEWDIPSSIVQGWFDNPGDSHGVIYDGGVVAIHWSGVSGYFDRFFQSSDLSNGPRLYFEYEPPTTPTPTGWTPPIILPTTSVTHTWPTPIGDNINPVVEFILAPTEAIYPDIVQISARATDETSLSMVQIWIGGELKAASYPHGAETTSVCTFNDTYRSLANGTNHLYYALAYDMAGNGASTSIMEVYVEHPWGGTYTVITTTTPSTPATSESPGFGIAVMIAVITGIVIYSMYRKR